MLRENKAKQLSFHSELYHKIYENHILKRIHEAIDLQYVQEILSKNYCQNHGRPAKEPEMLLRLHIIKYLYKLSDTRVIEELNVNLAYMWFVGMEPEEKAIDPSLMAKFRTLRLGGLVVDDIITELIRKCIDRGIIRPEDGISVDTTHVEANTMKKMPERIMKHLAKQIFKEAGVKGKPLPRYKEMSDHDEAKAAMKAYLEEAIESYAETAPKAVADAEAVLNSELFIEQKGIRSLTDRDARVGAKSHTEPFFGYKNEYVMTHSGLITAVAVNPGNYVDGRQFSELWERTEQSGIKVTALCGDKAYFRPDILKMAKARGIPAYIPVSPSSYRIDEERFHYNKDSDQWHCSQGNETVRVRQLSKRVNGTPRTKLIYSFEENQCKSCPCRGECMGSQTGKGKRFEVSVNTAEYYEHSQWAKTQEFRDGYKHRAKIEPKNAEQKRFHGLDRAYGFNQASVALQAKLTALATNLKRIAYFASPKTVKA